MKITIRQPLSFSECGLKDNQEDYIYPNPQTVSTGQRFFVLCDGMGGHEHGEVASSTVAEAMGEYLSQIQKPVVTPDDFEAALSYAYDRLDEKDINDGGKKMGTTMTCVVLHQGGALVAHIGDSRIYHINRKTGKRHVTSDHSLVNDLLKAGELTEEEAKTYPHRNIITRAMQPHQNRRSKAEISLLTDIEAGDYFFMCCDGVLEQLTDAKLCEILANPELNDLGKLAAIKAVCDDRTKDNYTCWLIPIDQVVKDVADTAVPCDEDVIQAISEDDNPGSSSTPGASGSTTPTQRPYVQPQAQNVHIPNPVQAPPTYVKPKPKPSKTPIIVMLLLAILCIGGYTTWKFGGALLPVIEQKAGEDTQKKIEEEAQKKAEEEAQKKAEEEAQKKAEEEAQKKAEEEAQKKAEEEALKKAEEEAAKTDRDQDEATTTDAAETTSTHSESTRSTIIESLTGRANGSTSVSGNRKAE